MDSEQRDQAEREQAEREQAEREQAAADAGPERVGTTPDPSEVDVAALAQKVAELERRNAQLEQAQSTPAGEPTTADVEALREQFSDWPQKGGMDVPQPWDHQALGINPTDVGPGERDTLSPVPFDHGKPILTAGAGGIGPEGDAVAVLCQALDAIGYETSWSEGENPFNLYDPSVERAVSRFRDDYGIQEDPSAFGGNHDAGRRAASAHCGPVTWAAVLRAAYRELQEA